MESFIIESQTSKRVDQIKNIRRQAEEYYRAGDFFCSEAVVKAVLEGVGREVSPEVIAMASGFPVGIGGAGCVCGALSGGVMAIGYVFGRSRAKGGEVVKAMKLSNQLHRQFKAANRSICCRTLTAGVIKGSDEHMTQCIRFTGDMAEQTAQIIVENI